MKKRERLKPDACASALLTDSYHLSMIQAYLDHGHTKPAVFEFFVRSFSQDRNFFVSAGLEQVLEYLDDLHFSAEELEYLSSTGHYREPLLSYLANFRFTGEIQAIPEGTLFFPNEPVLRVRAPLPEAQLIETRIINLLQYQILVASKAARSTLVGSGKLLVDFGLRRAHGSEAGLFAARASYLAGFEGTSTVLAGQAYGIPVFGTMAHSFVEAYEHELDAFQDFARSNPGGVTLLIDTYDTENGAERVVRANGYLSRLGIRVNGVRIDSGDLYFHSREVRNILDRAGLNQVKIFASGNIDEFSIRDLLSRGAPIDGFGVGTHLITSHDAPSLDCAYKLQSYSGIPKKKRSEGKMTLPGPKQVVRKHGPDGKLAFDVIQLESESFHDSKLVVSYMKHGKRLAPPKPLTEIRSECLRNLELLPMGLRSIVNHREYPVHVSEALRELSESLDAEIKRAAA